MDSVDDYGDPNWEPEPVDAGPGGWFISFFLPPPRFFLEQSLVVGFHFARFNFSCVLSLSLHIGNVLQLARSFLFT